MILLAAVLLGFTAGLIRARIADRSIHLPAMHLTWLVTIALIPQLLAFYIPSTSGWFSKEAASAALIVSQVGLLVFTWANRHLVAFWIMGIGLVMNLAVITANGGLMPVSPQTLVHLVPDRPIETWEVGERLGNTKDIVLPFAEMHLPWLADRFVMPAWYPWPTAFSLGDVAIALGAFGLLWQAGGKQPSDSSRV